MNLQDVEAFVAVVETGSIIGASAKLNLTQPGVTRRIQNLESGLGAALLDRQAKPLRPTALGREAYEHSLRLLRSVEDLKAGVSSSGEITGEFRLGIVPYLSEAALTLPLDRLRAAFPRLTLRIASAWSVRLADQVARSELDAVAVSLAEGVMPPPELASEDLGPMPVLLVAAKTLAVPHPASLIELARFPWVMNESGCGYRAFLRHTFESARLPFQVAVEAQSADLRMSLVARGLGIGIVTPAAFAESPWRDAIETVTTSDFNPQVRTWLLYRPPAGRLSQPIAVFREALIAALKLQKVTSPRAPRSKTLGKPKRR